MYSNYTIITHWYRDILFLKLLGQSTADNADAIAKEAIGIILQHDPPGIVVDVRELDGRLSAGETFFHVRNYPTNIPRYRTAILDLARNREYCEFYELAATNIGHNIRCFYCLDDAIHWLQSDKVVNA
jgi:hypothetical protein